MERIEISEEERTLSDKPFDLSQYSKTMFQMYGGREEDVSIEFDNDLVGVVLDRFGKDVPIIKSDENHFRCKAKVAVSPHFLSWLMGFGKRAKIISPKSVVDEMRELSKDIYEVYK